MRWKIKHFEFWNTHIFHAPIYLYWLYLSLKARSLFFFSAANPSIETGGLIGESKYKILQKIQPDLIPRTLFYENVPGVVQVMHDMTHSGLNFPVVVKPDVGQGGWLIDLIRNPTELENFLLRIKMPFMIQEYVDEPIEAGILYYRFPGQRTGTISSFALKELLTVTGNGKQTVRELMRQNPRADTQLKRLERSKQIVLSRIPEKGEVVALSFVGNHSYGTTFRNANHLIDEKLTKTFDDLCMKIDGFYFGRFDIRCKTVDALKEGDFKILELNGVGSEPLHIFDPNETLFNAYKAAFAHWRIIYEISNHNRKKLTYMRFADAFKAYQYVIRIQRLHNSNITIGN